MEGGTLKCGNIFLGTFLNYYFIIVNGTGGASLYILGVELEFVSAMNNVVFILGGMVTLKYIKINQQNMFWVSPLVLSDSNTSSVIVNLHSCTITNCKYKNSSRNIFSSMCIFFLIKKKKKKEISWVKKKKWNGKKKRKRKSKSVGLKKKK
jgi:hypothetical protein